MSNSTKEYDFLVFIGRFQPLHKGHCAVISQALKQSEKVIIYIGSSDRPRCFRNPFTFEERKSMIENVYHQYKDRLIIKPIVDKLYNDDHWVLNIHETTKTIIDNFIGNSKSVTLHGINDIKVGLIGHEKDNTSYYLKLFPDWHSVGVEDYKGLNATDIRRMYFESNIIQNENIPEYVYNFLLNFKNEYGFKHICDEVSFIKTYKKQWQDSPYPPIFVTVDAVVIQSGNILLVKRKSSPGKGQYALPGGFINENEKLFDAVIRELKEETKIKLPIPVLKGSFKKHEVFDHPQRSQRGRTITHTHLFDLPDKEELPKVKGSDDAEKAFWMPISDIPRNNMFEDHFDLILNMLGKI